MENKKIELDDFYDFKVIRIKSKKEIYDIYDKKEGFQGTISVDKHKRITIELINNYAESLMKEPWELGYLLKEFKKEGYETKVWVNDELFADNEELIVDLEDIIKFANLTFHDIFFKKIRNSEGDIFYQEEYNKYIRKFKNLVQIEYKKTKVSSIKALEEPYIFAENEREEYKIFLSDQKTANIMFFFAPSLNESEAIKKYMEIKKWKENGKDYRTEK